MCWELIAIFNLLKIRMRVDIFGTEKCKVTFGLKYMFSLNNAYNLDFGSSFKLFQSCFMLAFQ